MARIRSIKPEFWTSAQVLECSTNARLLFVGLWNFCDDCGRHPWSPKQVKAEVFPADPFTEEQIFGWLQELANNDLIRTYRHDFKDYFYVSGWKHQRIDKPQPAKYPDPFGEGSTTIPGTFPPDRIGKDKIGEDAAPAATAAPSSSISLEKELFTRGKQLLGRTGGGLVAKLLKAKGSVELARAALETAATKENAREYIGKVLIANGHKAALTHTPLENDTSVFVREDTEQWRAWQGHLRRTTGRGSPVKNFGWRFPSERPPGIINPGASLAENDLFKPTEPVE